MKFIVLRQIVIFIALLLVFINARAQQSGYTFLTWDNITLEKASAGSADTNIVIITSRNFEPQNKQFLGNEIDPEGKLRFLIASCSKNIWRVCVKNTFEEAMESLKLNRDLLFLVHGDGKTFPDLLDRCIRTERLYGLNCVVFDWPSRIPGYSRMRNFYNSKRNGKASVNNFKNALTVFEKYRLSKKIVSDTIHYSLFVHSLGNSILKGLVENSLDTLFREMKFDNIILNAPCVRQKKHKSWVSQMNFQNRIYITSNQTDRTLYGAHLITLRRQLGERLRKPLCESANYINFKNLVDKKHNYYLDLELFSEHPSIKQFYMDVFHGKNLDILNKSRFKVRKDGLGYDIL